MLCEISINPFIVDMTDESVSSIVEEAYGRAMWAIDCGPPSIEEIALMMTEVLHEEDCEFSYNGFRFDMDDLIIMLCSALTQQRHAFEKDGRIINDSQSILFPELGGDSSAYTRGLQYLGGCI